METATEKVTKDRETSHRSERDSVPVSSSERPQHAIAKRPPGRLPKR